MTEPRTLLPCVGVSVATAIWPAIDAMVWPMAPGPDRAAPSPMGGGDAQPEIRALTSAATGAMAREVFMVGMAWLPQH